MMGITVGGESYRSDYSHSNIPCRIIEVLLKQKRECISDDDEDGNTPLHLAALNGHHKCAKLLLDSQADYHARYIHIGYKGPHMSEYSVIYVLYW